MLKKLIWLTLLLLLLAVTACSSTVLSPSTPTLTPRPTLSPTDVPTVAAPTATAMPTVAAPATTAVPTAAAPTIAAVPTVAPRPIVIVVPTLAPVILPTPIRATCTYRATFLGDVTIPDNEVLAPGAAFVKTWRLRNDGTCAWGSAGFALHRLVFVGGNQLGAPTFVELPFPNLGYGGMVDVSVPMVAPQMPGTYASHWRLQVDNGPQVGVGPNGDTPLYAQIVVPGPATPTAMPPPTSKTFTSTKHHYVVSYPANWTISIQAPGGAGRDPEYVSLRSATAALPAVQINALKDVPPITGFENCNKNLLFRGVMACSISLPKGQIPATQLLIFKKGESFYHLASQYETQSQLAVFDDIVRSFQFTQ